MACNGHLETYAEGQFVLLFPQKIKIVYEFAFTIMKPKRIKSVRESHPFKGLYSKAS